MLYDILELDEESLSMDSWKACQHSNMVGTDDLKTHPGQNTTDKVCVVSVLLFDISFPIKVDQDVNYRAKGNEDEDKKTLPRNLQITPEPEI
ncbi:hypothetical protein QYM36_010871 [Artemia franciscana]|uniref:Uncharacterized protein n=1 Tax=Artemia franciscana TaxID=6661 RepID=A0AA88L417_ARTSF|nr:hypothetical protein QYM36_010871 [Artemia franciscana]